MCTKQDQEREKGIQPPVSHVAITISAMVSGRLGTMSRIEVFFIKYELYVNILLAYFLGNTCAKHYENPIMLSRVTAKNVGNVF